MTQTRKVKISIENFVLEAYQGDEGILFTHRQIGEAVGKTKEASQRYIKKRESELPPAIKVTIPERKGLIALTQWQSALVFWQYQADMGNIIAQNLIRAIGELKVTDFPIIPSLPPLEVSNPIPNHPLDGSIDPTTISPTLEGNDISPVTSDSSSRGHSVSKKSIEPKDVKEAINSNSNEVKLIADGIEVASGWMIETGIDKGAIVAWKLKELGKQILCQYFDG